MNDPKVLLGAVVAVIVVAFLLSKGAGPTYVQGSGPSAASYKAASDSNAQALSVSNADRQATLSSLRDVYGLNTTLKSHTLDLQAQAQSERARLDSALTLQQNANQGALNLAQLSANTQQAQVDAQLKVSQGQQAQAGTNSIFDFLLGAAKTILPFLF